jgi:capsular polysaccharide export protein
VIVANSTVGLFALREGRPVKVLGGAIYDVPGLTTAGSLDDFWATATAPDPALLQRFIATLAAEIQARGSFYEAAGRLVAADEMARRLLTGTVGPHAPVLPPPRLATLRRARLAAGST